MQYNPSVDFNYLRAKSAYNIIKNRIEHIEAENEQLKQTLSKMETVEKELRERLEKAVELPCKIGDKFYVVNDCPPEIDEKECWAFTFTPDGEVLIIDGLGCDYSLKIVYLSKEDAKACLEKLKGE